MTTTLTTTIDLTQLPAPEAIKPLDYEAILAARLASLAARFAAAGIPWDVGGLETDPAVILQEEDAFRELLGKAAINDAVRAVLPAFAVRSDLDHLASLAGLRRLTLVPADPGAGTDAVLESDAALLRRYLVSYSEPAAGSAPGYVSRALRAWPAARDVSVYKTIVGGQPRVNVVLLAEGGAPAPAEAVAAVHLALHAPDAAPLTAVIQVAAGIVVPWSYRARLTIRPGPDPAIVRAQAEAALRQVALERYRLGGVVPLNAASAPLYVANVLRVTELEPAFGGLACGPDEAPWLASLVLETEIAS